MLRSRLAPDSLPIAFCDGQEEKKKNQNGLRLSIWPCRFVLRHSRSVPLFFSFFICPHLRCRVCNLTCVLLKLFPHLVRECLFIIILFCLFLFFSNGFVVWVWHFSCLDSVCRYELYFGDDVAKRIGTSESLLATSRFACCGCLAPNSAIDPMCWFLHSQPPCETNKKLECCENVLWIFHFI